MNEIPHGTAGGYSNWRCRCGPCRVAAREAVAASKDRARQRLREDPEAFQHGIRVTYQYAGCRCEPCRQANTAYSRGEQ